MQLLSPKNFSDYELIDCGNFEKLERFGKYITIRPEPQAVWPKVNSDQEWEKTAHVKFEPRSSSSGDWKKLKQMPDQWEIRYSLGSEQGAVSSKQGAGGSPEAEAKASLQDSEAMGSLQ